MPRPTDLVASIVAAIAYVAVVFEVASDVEDPDEEHLVLLEQLDCTGNHLAKCVWAMHPKWTVMGPRECGAEALELFRTYRPPLAEDLRPTDLLHDALEQATRGARIARDGKAERRYRDVARELDFAADHLECALYLLDPDSFAVAIDATTPSQRVKLASRLEVIELQLEESRQHVRAWRASRLRR